MIGNIFGLGIFGDDMAQNYGHYDPHRDMDREQMRYMKEMMYREAAQRQCSPPPEAPKPPAHLNPKLLLTKGA